MESKNNCNLETNESMSQHLQTMDLSSLKKYLTANFVYKCTKWKCKFRFPTNQQRETHTAAHTNENELSFCCNDCDPKIYFKKWLDCCTHLWKVHNTAIGILKCPISNCNFRSQITAKVFRHLQTHNIIKSFKCEFCMKRFAKLELLKLHEKNHDNEDTKLKSRWYNQKVCEVCQNKFANSKTLSKHIKQVHNKIKPFICKVCGYSAARKSTITIHERQHTGEKPLQCNDKDCLFRAADPSVLAKHMKKHKLTQGRSYKCFTCNYATIQTSALKAHIRVKHAEIYDTKIKCDLCKFTSVNEKLLERHKLDHKLGLIDGVAEPDRSIIHNKASNSQQETSSDCFLPLESTDSLINDSAVYSGGFTIPATECSFEILPEDAQFPN